MLRKQDIEYLLDIKKHDFISTVRHSSKGPGYLDSHLDLNRHKNIWQHIEPVTASAGQKIIFCEPFTGQEAADPFTIMFTAALIKHFEVYLWVGPKMRMDETRPLASVAEFWDFIPTSTAATAEEVLYALAYQGCQASQFIIIDHEYFRNIINKWLASEMSHRVLLSHDYKKLTASNTNTLDFTAIPFIIAVNIASKVKANNITTLIALSPAKHEIEEYIKLFPKLHKIIVKHATPDWLNHTLNKNYGLAFEIKSFVCHYDCVIAADVRATDLSIKFSKNTRINSFTVTAGAIIKKLTLNDCSNDIDFDLRQTRGLRHLGLKKLRVRSLLLARDNIIDSLEVWHCLSFSNFTYNQFPLLKHLKYVGNVSTGNLRIEKFNAAVNFLVRIGIDLRGAPPLLETLEIGDANRPNHHHIDLSRAANLRSFKVDNPAAWTITYPPHQLMREEDPPPPTQPVTSQSAYQAWSEDGERFENFEETIDKRIDNLRYIRNSIHGASNSNNASYHQRPETVTYEHTHSFINPSSESRERNIPDSLKILRIYNSNNRERMNFNFTNKINLNYIDLKLLVTRELNLNFKGCTNLHYLRLIVGAHPIYIENLKDCVNLRALIIQSSNADIIAHAHKDSLPPECVIDSYKIFSREPNDDDDANHLGRCASLWARLGCTSRNCRCPSCITCPDIPCNPQISRGCTTALKIAGIASGIGISLAGIIAIALLIKRNYDESPATTTTTTLAPLTNTTTTPPATLAPPFPFALVFAGSAAGLLLLLCAGVLIYRFRHKLGLVADNRYDINLYGAARLNEPSLHHELDIQFNKQFEYNFYTGQAIDYNHMRLHVHNKMTVKRGNIYYHTDLAGLRQINVNETQLDYVASAQLTALMMEVAYHQTEALAYIQGVIKPGEMYPLPTLESMEDENDLTDIYSDVPHLVTFYYLPSTQQYYFSLDAAHKEPMHVYFFYRFKRNFDYLRIPYMLDSAGKEHVSADDVIQTADPATLLPESVLNYLRKYLSSFPPLAFMFDDELPTIAKINKLIDYVRDRSHDNTFIYRKHNDLLLEIIQGRKGVCRHASMAMFTLARMIGVPMDIVVNRGQLNVGHRFCAIPFVTAQGIRYRRVDLTLPDNTPELDIDQNIFNKLLPNQSEMIELVPLDVATSDDYAADMRAYEMYYQKFRAAVAVTQLESVATLLDTSMPRFSPLIQLREQQTALDVNDAIAHHLQAININTNTSHIYIDTPEDFLKYLHPGQIKDGRRINLQCGPLYALLTDLNETKVLIVNWSNFSDSQIASYQSLIDAEPYLSVDNTHLKLPPNVIVVGLIRHVDGARKAFLSRCKRFEAPDAFIKTKQKQPDNPPYFIDIDLYHCPTWREPVFGEIFYQGKRTELLRGALDNAIYKRIPLVIYNPPDDADFQQFLHQANEEGKVLHNGNMLILPRGVYIITRERELAMGADYIHVAQSLDPQDKRQRLYISINNLHEIYKQLHINAEHLAETIAGGLLRQYKRDSQVFYLIGDIPAAYWQAFVAHVKQYCPGFHIDIALAPNARIQGLNESGMQNETLPVPFQQLTPDTGNIIATNDIDFVTAHLKQSLPDAVIVYVTPQSTFSDLIARMETDSDQIEGFIYREFALFKALKMGLTIILSGDMSLTLFYQLQSLLSREPHICLNGERQIAKGRLISILPQHAVSVLPGVTHQCIVTPEDYSLKLASQPDFNAHTFALVKQFLHTISLMPHRGPGRPPQPAQNFQQLLTLMRAVNRHDPLYIHNPVKGWISYHYPRHSEDQAFVNVIAKMLFCASDNTPVRNDKLMNLVQQHNITNTLHLQLHLWQVLNCMHGEQLRGLLGSDKNINYGRGFPTVAHPVLTRILSLCTENTNHEVKRKHIPRVEKQFYRLQAALKMEDVSVILLKGDPGIGKTYTMRRLLGKYYEGEAGLLAFLQASAEEDPIYLWDEINMTHPGMADFLIKGLNSADRKVTYLGVTYSLSQRHKVVGTLNPEHYPGRYFHQSLLDYAFIINFDIPDDDFLLGLICKILPLHLQQHANVILYAFHQIKTVNPYFVTSIRDIENLSYRFAYLAKAIAPSEDSQILEALYDACTTEFAGSIMEMKDRAVYNERMRQYIGAAKKSESAALIPITDTVSITPQNAYLLNAIQQNLDIRLHALIHTRLHKQSQHSPSPLFFNDKGKEEVSQKIEIHKQKQAVILEGEPGIGKSTLFRAIVQQYKQSLLKRKDEVLQWQPSLEKQVTLAVLDSEMNKPVYEISVGSADAVATLTRALDEEAIVIGDESNMDPVLDAVLLQYLSGVDQDKHPISKPGFIFLGSKNSSIHAGRPNESPASRNRTHFLYMDSLTRHEYQLYADDAKIAHPKQFVRAFYTICREFPSANARTFHVVLKAEKAEMLLKQEQNTGLVMSLFADKRGEDVVLMMDEDDGFAVDDGNEMQELLPRGYFG